MLNTAPIRAYIPASDVARARKFYEQIIGLQPKLEYAGGVIYECGGSEVFMYPTSNAGSSKASQAFWQVDDVEAEVADLKARGVKFEEYTMPGIAMKNSIVTAGGAKTAWFKDTEGNILAISQRMG
jgi:predicted enzyme related to lactoylglutathione lyase